MIIPDLDIARNEDTLYLYFFFWSVINLLVFSLLIDSKKCLVGQIVSVFDSVFIF